MTAGHRLLFAALILCAWGGGVMPARAEESQPTSLPPAAVEGLGQDRPAKTLWHYGAYLDLTYPIDFNYPANHIWRSKVTTQKVNELSLNVGNGLRQEGRGHILAVGHGVRASDWPRC